MNKKENKKQRIGDEFKQLQTKIFVRTAIIMFAALVIVFVIDIVNITLHFFLKDVRSMLPPAVNHSISVS